MVPPKGVPHRKSVYVFYASTLDREGTIGTFGPLRDRWGHPIESMILRKDKLSFRGRVPLMGPCLTIDEY